MEGLPGSPWAAEGVGLGRVLPLGVVEGVGVRSSRRVDLQVGACLGTGAWEGGLAWGAGDHEEV